MTAPSSPSCARCGEAITPGARFCMKCGADVSGEQGGVTTAMMPVAQERDPAELVLELLKHATLGEYEILRELGRGGMATVYLAHDIALDRKVAVKVMSPALLLMGEGMVERFKREARTAASLSHPHIIPIYTVKSAGKTLFFVMKFIAGRSLEAVIHDLGPMPIPIVRTILQQVGSALGYAHRHGIVHRDVKPANIMIDEEGWSVVTDFGIAKVAENRGLTMTGIAVGTPSYMSPEQCAAKDITGRSDQYSLGVVAYEMLTGHQPFRGDSAMAIMFAHFHEAPRPLLEVRPDCPPDLADAVMRMLEKGPDQRWPSMEDAVGAMGAQSLAHDDPMRRHLVELVRSRSNRHILESITPPPTSPAPPARPSAPARPEPAGPRIASVTVVPPRSELHPGDTVQLAATPRAASGTAAISQVEWRSSDPAVATVTSSGLVTAVAVGSASITAAAEGVTGATEVVVTVVPVARLVLDPAAPRLGVGETVQLRAVPQDQAGATVAGRAVTWSATPAGVVRVSSDGQVTAEKAGDAQVIATCEGVAAQAVVTVTPPAVALVLVTPAERTIGLGDTAALTPIVADGEGRPLTDRELGWKSSAKKIVAVSPRGIVTGLAEGTAEITLSCEGKQATARIVVQPAEVASVTVAQPGPIVAGDSLELKAVLKDARGKAVTGRTVEWSSAAPDIATVSPAGLVSALAPGTAKVTAESGGRSWTVSVTVLAAPVATVEIGDRPLGLAAGDSATLRAVARDAEGKELPGREVAWSSSNTRVLTVGPDGTVTARTPGEAKVRARIEGKQAEVKLKVAPAAAPGPVAEAPPAPSATMAVPAASAPTESPTELIARVPPPAPAEPARRRTEPTAMAEAAAPARSRKGIVIAAVVGVAVVVGAVVLFRPQAPEPLPPARPAPAPVSPAPVATLALSGETGPLAVGRTRQLAALAQDSTGTEVSGRDVTWSSSDSTIATVTAVGAVTALKPGPVTISATSEGKTASLALTIAEAGGEQPVPVASLALSGGGKALDVGGTLQLEAEPRDAKGKPLPDRTVVWSSRDPGIALVSSAGLVTAVAPGQVAIEASSEGRSATTRVTVKQPPPPPVAVVSLAVTPENPGITVGQTVTLSAAVLDAARQRLDRPVQWQSSDPQVARVAGSGVVIGLGAGSATITATAEGKSGSTRVTVTAPAVTAARVVLTAPTRSLKVGETATWTARPEDARGRALSDRAVSWASSRPQVARVSDAGVVTAVAPGSADIRAEADGKSASATVTVAAAPAPPPTPTPTPAPPPTTSALLPHRDVVAGGSLSCGLVSGGAVCWGGGVSAPSLISGTAGMTAVTVGRNHACGLLAGGKAVCWGENKSGQLGNGSNTASAAAVAVAGDLSFSMLSAGEFHTCGIAGGKAWCWGRGKSGQLGDGSTSDRKKPVRVSGGQSFVAVAAGGSHTCAITGAGKAYCWGDGYSGQLGYGNKDQLTEPIDVSGNQKYAAIGAGDQHTCGLTTSGRLYCWGGNQSGQLGDGSTSDRLSPVAVNSKESFTALAVGENHTCGLAGSRVFCWGENRHGQLGDGSRKEHHSPVEIPGSYTAVSAGQAHTCAVTAAGEPVCWGENKAGQLGDGSTAARAAPGPVRAER